MYSCDVAICRLVPDSWKCWIKIGKTTAIWHHRSNLAFLCWKLTINFQLSILCFGFEEVLKQVWCDKKVTNCWLRSIEFWIENQNRSDYWGGCRLTWGVCKVSLKHLSAIPALKVDLGKTQAMLIKLTFCELKSKVFTR